MAYQNPITNWLIRRKDQFKLSYTQYEWPERYGLDLHDFSAQIEFGNLTSNGRGLSTHPEVAIEKASAEVIERYICQKLGIPSTGVAVSGESSSLIHAENEALERYYLNQHLKRKIPLAHFDLGTENLSLITLIAQIQKRVPSTDLDFFRMQTMEGKFGLVCSIQNKINAVHSFGFSFGTDLRKVFAHSLYEALPNFVALCDDTLDASDSERPWHLKKVFRENIISLLKTDIDSQKLQVSIAAPQLKLESIGLDRFPELEGCPISPIRVQIVSAEVDP